MLVKAKQQGKGHWPVCMQIVEAGLTMSQEIDDAEIAHRSDGERIWLHPKPAVDMPLWMNRYDCK